MESLASFNRGVYVYDIGWKFSFEELLCSKLHVRVSVDCLRNVVKGESCMFDKKYRFVSKNNPSNGWTEKRTFFDRALARNHVPKWHPRTRNGKS